MAFSSILSKGALPVQQLDRLEPHVETTIWDRACFDALRAISRVDKQWPKHTVIAWLLNHCDVIKLRTWNNILADALTRPGTAKPERAFSLSLIERACKGELHFAQPHDLIQDFNERMVGRRIFVGGSDVTRQLVDVFSGALELHSREELPALLFRHNLAIGVGADWVKDVSYTLAFPVVAHKAFVTPMLVELATLSDIDEIISRMQTGSNAHQQQHMQHAYNAYRGKVVGKLQKKKRQLESVAAAVVDDA